MQEARPDTASGSNQAASESSAASQIASKAHEVYRVQEELLQQRQKLAFQDIQAQELHAALQAAKNKAQQAQDEGVRQVLCSALQLSLPSCLHLCICFTRLYASWCLATPFMWSRHHSGTVSMKSFLKGVDSGAFVLPFS